MSASSALICSVKCIRVPCVVGVFSEIDYVSLGCYKHGPGSMMTVLEDPEVLDGNYKLRADAVGKCALAASKRGYNVFAAQDGGLCLVGDSFNKYGISQDCKSDGKGGPEAINVYIIGGIQGKIMK